MRSELLISAWKLPLPCNKNKKGRRARSQRDLCSQRPPILKLTLTFCLGQKKNANESEQRDGFQPKSSIQRRNKAAVELKLVIVDSAETFSSPDFFAMWLLSPRWMNIICPIYKARLYS